jgi:tetratricopeptide (TPR) repeat protein
MGGVPDGGGFPDPPASHLRAAIWLAKEALERKDPNIAVRLLSNAGVGDDPLKLRVWGEAQAAVGHFNKAIETWIKAGDYQMMLQFARRAVEEGRMLEAERAYFGAWQVDPVQGTLPFANFLWGKENDPAAAEKILRVALREYNPNHLNWLRALGNVLRAQERWVEAIDVYQQALIQNPEDLYTMRLLGDAYYLGYGDQGKASQYYLRMISAAPGNGDGYFAMGWLMAKEGHHEEADRWFAQAIDLNPDEPKWWLVRANTARDWQNLALALDIYGIAVERFPDYSLLYFEIARAYMMAQMPDEAVRAIEKALELNEDRNPWYFVRAGEIYEWIGQKESAIEAYKHVLQSEPNDLSARQAAANGLRRLDSGSE